MSVTLICGDSREWDGTADLVLTNPYGPLPQCLREVPAIVTNFAARKALCEGWCGSGLTEIGTWGRAHRNSVWVRGLLPLAVPTADLAEEEVLPGRGFFPLDLPLRLLTAYGAPGMTVCDPFMGRGTVGKACHLLGMDFIGIDIDPDRVAMAKDYLGC